MKKTWRLAAPEKNAVDSLCSELGCHPVIAAVLVSRGVRTSKEAERFLNPTLHNLRHPNGIKDIDKAAARICRAIAGRERVMIFGDYDVDGVTAATLLHQFLNSAGASATCHLPHRMTEGYGLKPFHISEVAAPAGAGLIVTVDCGSSSHDAVALARQKGMDVIITDHHEPPAVLPAALAVVNPKRRDCGAGFEDLAGVGVAFYLAIGVRRCLRDAGFWKGRPEPNLKKACDLVALGTVADMVPLTRENRVLTRIGLEVMRSGHRCGLNALMQSAGIDRRFVSSEDLAYKIAPRINAAGRISHADLAARLLTSTDPEQALQAAEELNRLNSFRQEEEKRILDTILNQLEAGPELLSPACLVLSGSGWHEGVIGIIAARLAARFLKPVILVSTDGEPCKGSGRSVNGFNLYEAVAACGDLLLQFGGHAMAAGLQVEKEKIDLLRERLTVVGAAMTDQKEFGPEIVLDHELRLDAVTPELADQIERLNPFGNGNPEPLFLGRDVRVLSSSLVGGRHRRMTLAQAAAAPTRGVPAIQFNADPAGIQQNYFSKMAFKIQWNRWNGNQKIQLLVEDIDET